MPLVRKHAKRGDVIVGIAGSGQRGLGRIHRRLIYWMQVEETPTFDEYWADPRFRLKRPAIGGPKMYEVGDRTYRHEADQANWSQEESMHYRKDVPRSAAHMVKDTSVDRVLVASRYTYWGGHGPEVPLHLMELFPSRRGQKCPPPGLELDELHALIDLQGPSGLKGDPADWGNKKYFP